MTPVVASDYRAVAPVAADGQMNARFLPLGVGKSVVVDLPRDIKDVLVADPKIANAVVRSAQRAYIIGAAVGQTNIVFFDSAGQQIAAYDIAVKRDLNGVRAALKQALARAESQFRAPRLKGRVRLGSSDDVALGPLPAVLAAFRDAHPDVELEITIGMTGREAVECLLAASNTLS